MDRLLPSRPPARARRRLVAAVLLAGLVVAGVAALYQLTVVPTLADWRHAPRETLEQASIVYAADGTELTRFYRTHRVWVDYHEIAPTVVDALVATEDHRFYEHRGIDLRRLVGSVWRTLRGRRQGGSTIPMQLARNLIPAVGDAPVVLRKLRELVAAVKLERRYAKHELVTLYLNTVPFGQQAFGIEAAARAYFGKRARALDVLESATLVALLKGPSRYNPVRHPERARRRRDLVLGLMVRHERLDAQSLTALRAAPLRLRRSTPAPADRLAPHFSAYVQSRAERWAEANGYDLYTDGLRIHTTLQPALQALAEAAVTEQLDGLQAVAAVEWSTSIPPKLGDTFAPYRTAADQSAPFAHFWTSRPDVLRDALHRTSRYRRLARSGLAPAEIDARLLEDGAFVDSVKAAHARLEAGLVALDPYSGHVLAWVGGRDFGIDQYDHVGQARRQPGSTFKPFVYAAALDRGFTPGDTLRDARVAFSLGADGATWTPRNAGSYSGRYVSLRDGLAWSKNTISAQLMAAVGPERVADVAHRMGIRSPLAAVPSLALGTSEVTLLELTGAYGTLANGGVHQPPIVVTRIEAPDGSLLARFAPDGQRALSRYTAYMLLDMLRDVVRRGTGARLRTRAGVRGDLAGKTGTTQNLADGWFVAMHPRLVAGAWVGFNDRRLTFRTDDWGHGSRSALPVVGAFFERALDAENRYTTTARFVPPPGYTETRPAVTDVEAVPHPERAHEPATTPLQPRDAWAEGLRAPAPEPPAEADAETQLRRSVRVSQTKTSGNGS